MREIYVVALSVPERVYLCSYLVKARDEAHALEIVNERALLHGLREVEYETTNPVDLRTTAERGY